MGDIKLYDTTLRDGAQTEGISYSLNDKLRIAEKLDELGIHYIEGGWPGSNPKDMAFFKEIKKSRLKTAEVVAFGSTRRANVRAYYDTNLKALLLAKTRLVTIFGKTSCLHVRDVLKVSQDENLKMISDSVKYLKSKGLIVFYDAEHYFDGYKESPEYAIKTILAAQEAGCSCVVLCDTNGGTITSDLVSIVEETKKRTGLPLGIHTHNDSDMAVANSIAAVQAGCSQVQGTINGYGERCGNANLISIIPILKLKLNIDCISDKNLKELTEVSRYIANLSNMVQQDHQPFVGRSAFAHKAGIHINAVVKNTATYEHIEPSKVGAKRRILLSELAGRTSIVLKAKEIELDFKKDTATTRRIHSLLQSMEHKGYQFETAEGSFELMMKRALKRYKPFFELEGFRVIVEKRQDNRVISEATIKLKVKGIAEHTAAEGDGPVNALDNALRKALKDFYPTLAKMHLTDFKVRVLDAKEGTAAKVRVLIESQDEKNSWGTVGVSENIIEASWQALVDSIEYKLLKDKIK